jgi:hypothetical protein
MFFSEEKNFTSCPPVLRYGNWPAFWEGRGSKSFLLLFFKKEGLVS